MKHHILLMMTLVGLPHNLRLETTADTEKKAALNALYHLRSNGHAVYNVPPRVFGAEYKKCKEYMQRNGQAAFVRMIDPSDPLWERARDLRT